MLEEIAKSIAKAQAASPKKIIGIFILITLLLLPGLVFLVGNVEPSLERVLPPNIHEVRLMNQLRTDLGVDMMYIVVYADGFTTDIRSPEVMQYTNQLEQRLRSIPHVREVFGPADVLLSAKGHIPQDETLLREFFAPQMRTAMMADDASLLAISLRTDTGANAVVIKEVVIDVQDAMRASEPTNPGVSTKLTGYNTIDKATFEVIISDFMKITLLSFALIALVVFATFRTLKKTLMPLLTVMMAVLWTMGIVGYLGLTITVVSMVSIAMVLGLGIDFGIHVTYVYYHQRQTHAKKLALTHTLKELLRAMLGGSLTTAAGFLALLFGVLPAMKILGIVLGIGILSTLIGAVLLLPAVLYLTDTGDIL